MELSERLDMLLSGEVISKKTDTLMRRIQSRFRDKWNIELNEENGGRMITHLAMALMRVERQEQIEGLAGDALDEYRREDFFPKAVEIVDDLIQSTPINLPDAERDYLIAYICLLLEDFDDLNESGGMT